MPGKDALGEVGNTADLIMQASIAILRQRTHSRWSIFTSAGVVPEELRRLSGQTPGNQRDSQRDDGAARLGAPPPPIGRSCRSTWAKISSNTGWSPKPSRGRAGRFADYLATDMVNRLAGRAYRFVLEVQRRTRPETMPLNQAMVESPEDESAFIPVATLEIPRQRVDERGHPDYGQSLSFNIWRVPEAECAERGVVDRRGASRGLCRRRAAAPHRQRPAATGPDRAASGHARSLSPGRLYRPGDHLSRHRHRAGRVERRIFLRPRSDRSAALPPGSYRDEHKKLKRQAARFRIYGCNARGERARADRRGSDAEIEWKVELAKSEGGVVRLPARARHSRSQLRAAHDLFATLRVADRSRLAITPGAPIRGANTKGSSDFRHTAGSWTWTSLSARRDRRGRRLTVLGGKGISQRMTAAAVTFANNEGWHDDVSDGPVTAKVVLNGGDSGRRPAWVVVAPPNYGPAQ